MKTSRLTSFIIVLVILTACQKSKKEDTLGVQGETNNSEQTDTIPKEIPLAERFILVDSRFRPREKAWSNLSEVIAQFTEENYQRLKPVILDKSIPEIQQAVRTGKLTYKELALFYLYRIQKNESNSETAINAIISLNPNIIEEAEKKDKQKAKNTSLLYGIPLLIKDNINTKHMPTTAGAVVLADNITDDAFVVTKLKAQGALILGKTNLSEWAYFFCGDCPSGYSAVGGQTLNPYGPRVFDTGGSSSGSGAAIAANYAVAALGTETSGSILSPSSQNGLVGLKPTIGLASRGGIVPISSTLDTPGPMAKNVIDAAIVLKAMAGEDPKDIITSSDRSKSTYVPIDEKSIQGKRFGAINRLKNDSLYLKATKVLADNGAEIVWYQAPEIDLPDFVRLLNLDMKKDLPDYMDTYANPKISQKTIMEIMAFNKEDTVLRAPYGQALFEGIQKDSATLEEFDALKKILKENGRKFFDQPMQEHRLDAVLSINNYHAGYAAVAHYPALTVPMGLSPDGEPKGLTFIGKPWTESDLLNYGFVYEKESQARKSPTLPK